MTEYSAFFVKTSYSKNDISVKSKKKNPVVCAYESAFPRKSYLLHTMLLDLGSDLMYNFGENYF